MQSTGLDSSTHLLERAAASSDDDSDAADADGRRRRKRRRHHAHAGDSTNADAVEAYEPGQKDHLFFTLRPHEEGARAPLAPGAAPAPVSLCVFGAACQLHADSAAAASLRLGSHLQRVDVAPARRRSDSDNDSDADEQSAAAVLVDRFDVRVLLPVIDWRQETEAMDDIDEEQEGTSTTGDRPSEPAAAVAEPAAHSDGQASPPATDSAPPQAELLRERMSAQQYDELQRERYLDYWAAQGGAQLQAPASDPPQSTTADADPSSVPLSDSPAAESDETIEEENRKRRLMAERGQLWHYAYGTDAATPVPASTTASAPIAPLTATVADPIACVEPAVRRPPPPPPRKRVPPPPPPRNRPHASVPSDAAARSPADSASPPVAAAAAQPSEPAFTPAFTVPPHILLPHTLSEHRVIAHTVHYVRNLGAAGAQQEIMLKVRQKDNPRFYFLNYDHPLHPYYQWAKTQPDAVLDADHAAAAAAAPASLAATPTDQITTAPTAAAAGPLPLAAPHAISAAPAAPTRSAGSTRPPPPGMRGSRAAGASASSVASPSVEHTPANAAASAYAPPRSTPSPPHQTADAAASDTRSVAVSPVESPTADNGGSGSSALHGLVAYGSDSDSDTEADGGAASVVPPLAPSASRARPASLPLPPPPPVLPIPASLLPLLPAPPAPIPPAPLLRVIHRLVASAHRHGAAFERLTAARERNNPDFAFLTDPHSPFRAYFEWLKFVQPMIAEEEKSIRQRDAQADDSRQTQAHDDSGGTPGP